MMSQGFEGDTSDATPVTTPSGSLIDLYDSPAVLEINNSAYATQNHAPRSRTSSVSSQASDSSLFSPVADKLSKHRFLPSETESASESEDSHSIMLHSVSKDELYSYYCLMQEKSKKYRWKFSQVSFFHIICKIF